MSSKRVEDLHTSMLEKLLSSTGIVCRRPAVESPGESIEMELEPEEGKSMFSHLLYHKFKTR